MLKNIFKIAAIFIFGMAGGIFATEIFWPYFVERPLFYQYRLERAPVYVVERKEIIVQENLALRSAIEKVEKTVAGVRTKTRTGITLEGSGLVVTSDGLVVTLADLVPAGGETNVFLEGKNLSFKILKRDAKENLALLKTEETDLSTAGFADSERAKLGERVFLLGVVFNGTKQVKTVNEGIIKSFDENLIKTNISEKNILKGSPLFNIEGSVLGLNIIDREGKVNSIPISKVKNFIGL